MLKLKSDVKLDAMQPQTLLAIMIAAQVYARRGYDCVVTSVNDSTVHKIGSMHYRGRAADFRLNSLKEEDRVAVVGEVAVLLGDDFDVLHEYIGTAREHMHVEYDPKR